MRNLVGDFRYGESSPGDQLMKAFKIFLIIIALIGLTYLTWVLFLKDLLLLIREKHRRTQTTSGYGGNTNNQGGNIGLGV